MPLKEELEILRGEPISVFDGDPMDIPCIETSDEEKLCKRPVVSVGMLAYNHEPYIRRAIEGVMRQQTDFEFELVIGEDCSQDKTREICFEYQKKHPDKIRVLWWHENLRKVNHPAGVNGRRTWAHCRGEFIAFCEGDDYWTDPLKLQKQVDVMRKHPNVGLCFARAKIAFLKNGRAIEWNSRGTWHAGVVSSKEFFLKHLFGVPFSEGEWPASIFLVTASVLLRTGIMRQAVREHEILKWRLQLGDTPLWLGMAALSDAYYLDDSVAVYQRTGKSVCYTEGDKVFRDATITRLYYFVRFFGKPYDELPANLLQWTYRQLAFMHYRSAERAGGFRGYLEKCKDNECFATILNCRQFRALTWIFRALNRPVVFVCNRYVYGWLEACPSPRWIKAEYESLGQEYHDPASGWVLRLLKLPFRLVKYEFVHGLVKRLCGGASGERAINFRMRHSR